MDLIKTCLYQLSNDELDENIEKWIDKYPSDENFILFLLEEKQHRMLNEISCTYETNSIEESKPKKKKNKKSGKKGPPRRVNKSFSKYMV